MRTKAFNRFILTILSSAFALQAMAAEMHGTVGTSVTGGNEYTSYNLRGNIDLTPSWSVTAWIGHETSDVDFHAVTNQGNVGASFRINDNHAVRGRVFYGRDTFNNLEFTGPSFGYTFALNEQVEDPEQGLIKKEVLAAYFDADILFYKAKLPPAGGSGSLSRIGSLDLTQFHPMLELDKQLFGGMALAYVAGGHYFYSDDPLMLDFLIARDNRLRNSGAVWMVGALLKNNVSAGLVLYPRPGTSFRVDAGRLQSALSERWSTNWGAGASQLLFGSIEATLSVSRAMLFSDRTVNYVTFGLDYLF